MESHHGGADPRASLRLVDTGGETVWEPDPAVDTDELDALAELFIGDADEGYDRGEDAPDEPLVGNASHKEPKPDGARASAVEAVITGHLPVRGAVWVRAYAAAVAHAERRPIALVRVTGERTTIELVGSSVETEPVRDAELAIQAVSSATEHWLLHFDELDQAGMLRERGFDRVTVLSGADEPAVVSAYRLLKSLSDDRRDAIAEGSLDVGISIVGSGNDETVRATDRIGIAARRFLEMELSPRRAVPRIETATVSLIGELDERCEPGDLLGTISGCMDGEAETAALRPSAAAARIEAVLDSARPGPVIQTTAAAKARTATQTATQTGAHTETKPQTQTQTQTYDDPFDLSEEPSPAHSSDASAGRPNPASMIAGLTSLDLFCPVADSVEIATDDKGGLHLVSWWGPGAASGLLKARVWAGVNLPLLAKLAGLDTSAARRATLHAVCTSIGEAADLRGAELTVHLAQPIAKATNGWVTSVVD